PVQERLRFPFTARAREGNLVCTPICSAMCWSSEIELWNELLAGCGAAVKKLTSEGWPPSTFGCDTPLNTVKSFLCSFSVSRYGDAAYSRPAPVGKKLPGR